MPIKKVMKIHPLCRMFGKLAPLNKDEKAQMMEDIRVNGIRVPILVNKKKKDTILDGATRWGMAYDLKLDRTDPEKVPFTVFESDDEAEIKKEIASRNLHRRHMNDEQRVAIVSELFGQQLEAEAKERKGGRPKKPTMNSSSVSPKLMARAQSRSRSPRRQA